MIRSEAVDSSADINIYYVNSISDPDVIGYHFRDFSDNSHIFIQDSHTNSAVNVSAHEVGHALDIDYESSDPLDVMFAFSSPDNPCNVKKRDWDEANEN